MKRVKLKVLGISYSQTQSGAYALILVEENGERRVPIIIGGFEAQAIVIKLENLDPPRPLTHDLFRSFASEFNISIIEVMIYKLEEGVFYSRLLCNNGEKEISIEKNRYMIDIGDQLESGINTIYFQFSKSFTPAKLWSHDQDVRDLAVKFFSVKLE